MKRHRKSFWVCWLLLRLVDGERGGNARHIHPSYWSEQDRFLLNRGRWRQETTDATSPTSTIAFRSSSQALSPEVIVRTIRLGSDIDGPLRECILLADFTQPEVCTCRATEHPIFAASVKAPARDQSRCRSERLRPLPGAILFRCVFHSHRHQEWARSAEAWD